MSKFVTLHGFGSNNENSGSIDLNFEVVGGTTEPVNPKENTIWVNTNNQITGWLFDYVQPSNPSEGLVWFEKISTTAPAEFNALSTNGIKIRLNFARQYVNGVWIDLDMRVRQNNTWIEYLPDIYIYNNGVINTDMFGDLQAYAYVARVVYDYASLVKPTVTKNTNSIKLYAYGYDGGDTSTNNSGSYFAINPVDLTNYKTISLEVIDWESKGDSGRTDLRLITTPEIKSMYELSAQITAEKVGTVTLDVSSLSGEHYIGISLAGKTSKSITFTEWKLTR